MDPVTKLRQELRAKMVALRTALQIKQPHLEGEWLHEALESDVLEILAYIDFPKVQDEAG